jgi:hypothetical protein
MVHAHDARGSPAGFDAAHERRQHAAERMAGKRAEQLEAEGRADADHHFAGVGARGRLADAAVGDAARLALA